MKKRNYCYWRRRNQEANENDDTAANSFSKDTTDIVKDNKERKEKEEDWDNRDYSIFSNNDEVTSIATEDQLYSPVAMDIIDEKHKEVGDRNDEDSNDKTTTKTASSTTAARE